MTEATMSHNSLVRPEYEQAATELVALLKQQLPSLELLADFPAKSDDMNKAFEWLKRYSAFYDDDEGLRDAVGEVQKLDAAQRAIEADTITKEARQCQPVAEQLYHMVDEVITLYDAVVMAYDRPLDIAAVRSEATALLEEVAQRAYDEESGRLYRSLSRIFPPRVAEVNVPDGCTGKVPTVKRWQREHNITDREIADQEYMRLTAEACQGVQQDFAVIGGVTFALTAEVPDDLRMVLPLSVYDELHRCVARMKKADESDCSIGERLERQLAAARRCVAVLQSHAEASLKVLHEQYARQVVEAQQHEVATTARQVASRQFMDILEGRLEMLNTALRMYSAAPSVAASGLHKAAVKKKKRRKGSAPVENEARTQEVREMTLRPGKKLFVDNKQLPWLGDDDILRSVIAVERGAENVAVLDMRTPATKAIEHKMAGYETKERRQGLLPIIADKLQLIAQAMASGGIYLDHLRHMEHHDADSYPLPISYWGNITSNAVRVYVARVKVANMPDGELRRQLMDSNVDELLLYLGACDKHRQVELLQQFTGHDRRRLVGRGAGSI